MCSSRTHVTQEPWRTLLYNWTMRRGMRTNIPLDFAHMVAHGKFKDQEAKARETPKLLLAGAGMLCGPCPNSYAYLCPPFRSFPRPAPDAQSHLHPHFREACAGGPQPASGVTSRSDPTACLPAMAH